MDYLQAFSISSAGMTVERMRVDVAALNLANAHTIQTPDGMLYQPAQVVARSAPTGLSFADQFALGLEGAPDTLLPEASIEPSLATPRSTYEPGHPFANERGFVTYPGVDSANEMVTLTSALRAYEANVAALNMARTLALKALEIGGAP